MTLTMVWIGVALAIGVVLVVEVVLRSRHRASDLGSVSDQWIAEQRRAEGGPHHYMPKRRA
jgi:hypothetical protein